jgi:ABC-type uncharacterized transport system ATPase subunit
MNIPIVQLDPLQKGFDAKMVLPGIDLAIEPRTILGSLGSKRTGKTRKNNRNYIRGR